MQPKSAGESVHVVVKLCMCDGCIDLCGPYISVSKQFAYRLDRNALGEGNGCCECMACCMEGNGTLDSGLWQNPPQTDVAPAVARQRENRIGRGFGPVF